MELNEGSLELMKSITVEITRDTPESNEKVYETLSNNPNVIIPRHGTPLHLACYLANTEVANGKNFKDIVKKYLTPNVSEEDAKINVNLNLNSDILIPTPLIAAVKGNNFEVVKLLLENGANPNDGNNYRSTPLHFAIEYDPEITRLLMEYGADPNAEDVCGNTPLSCAMEEEDNEMIQILLKK